jgi:hypothetical protein
MVSRKRSKKKNKGEEIALVVGGVVVLAVVLFVVLGPGALKVGNCCATSGGYANQDHKLTNNVFTCKGADKKWHVGRCK